MNEPTIKNITLSDNVSIAVGKKETVTTDAIKLGDINDFALEYMATCTGTPDVKIEVLQSSDNVNYYVPDNMADIVTNLMDKNYHGCKLGPICVQYIKFRITENTDINTDTVLTMKLSYQKKFSQ